MIRGSITYVAPPDTLKRDLRKATENGLKQAASEWHDTMLPHHFERNAHQRYNYKNRKPKYIKRKLRKTGQALDLIFTGRLERAALKAIKITGNYQRVKGVLVLLPKYAYMTKPGTPDKAAELVAVTQDEVNALADTVDKTLSAHLKNTETRTVKV